MVILRFESNKLLLLFLNFSVVIFLTSESENAYFAMSKSWLTAEKKNSLTISQCCIATEFVINLI